VWLASVTGNPIIPFHLEADRHWTLRSWDRTQIPQPFATIALAFAPPIQVAAKAGDAVLDDVRRQLEQSLAGCEHRCAEMLCR
jgi:lysophospholipid acyltransferase (LPLAT)-like uncharacterized protein